MGMLNIMGCPVVVEEGQTATLPWGALREYPKAPV